MRYINTKTGAIIETSAKISGADWKPMKKEKTPEPPKVNENPEKGADES